MNKKTQSKSSILDGLPVLGLSSTGYRRNGSAADEALLEGSNRLVRDGVPVLKLPLTRHHLRRSFAIE
jgi:hypothetical protein